VIAAAAVVVVVVVVVVVEVVAVAAAAKAQDLNRFLVDSLRREETASKIWNTASNIPSE
jgi:hypothetical protein